MSLAHETGTSAFPYPGLRPYDQSEADLFFGREEHVDQLLGKLEVHRFLAVIGPSGCGKSSLVRAGLLPALETGFMASAGIHWRSAVLRPESEPLRNLAKALLDAQALGSQTEDLREELGFLAATLRRGPLGLVEAVRAANLPERTNLLVLVDQFEELFRFHRLGGTSESNAFVDLLLASVIEPSESIYVVLTMRSDYLGNCPVFRGLPEAMNESQFLTPRLTREQNRAAIVGPAAMFGVKVEPGVVTRILNEMGTDPDQLPLMQHLLMRMWRRATQGRTESDYGGQVTLTMDDFEKVGGLANALSTHVERIYQELPDGRCRKIAETAFRNLTEITPDGQVNRRPVKVSEISEIAEASTQEIADVLDEFRQEGRSFLMPPISTSLTQDSVIDISHESLIRQWKRLKDWTREEDKARQTVRSVKGDLGTWKKTRQNEQALLHGLRLLEAEEWAKTHPHQVEQEECDYLKLSRDAVQREAKVKRRRDLVIAILGGVLTLVFLIFGVVSFYQLRHAVEAETRAKKLLQENIETKAKGLAAASRRLLEQRNDPAGALALAVEAQNTAKQVEAECPTEVEQSLLSALCSQRMVPPLSSFFSASADNVTAIALSPDGQWIATGGGGSGARLWGLDPKSETTRMSMVNLDGHSHSVDTVALSEGSPRVATLDHEGVPRLWVTNGTNQATKSVVLKNRSQPANVIALSRDGTWLVAGCKAGEVRLWHLVGVDNPVPGESLAGHSSDVVCVTFDENSRRLATADDGGGVKVWDLSSRDSSSSARPLSGHSEAVLSLAFSHDGQRLASASRDGSTRYWNLGDVTVAPEVFRDKSSDESSPHLAVCVSPDGQKIATGCSNGIVLIWDANDPKAKPRRLPAASSMSGSSSANPEIGKLTFSPGSGRWLAAMDYSGRIWLWDLNRESPLLVSLPEANPNTLAPNRESGFRAPRLPAHLGGFAFTADAQTLMTINGASGLLSWDLSNFAPAEPFDPFSPRKLFTTWTQDTLTESDGAPSSSPSATAAERDGRLWSAAMADTSASPVFIGPPLQSYGAMPRDTKSHLSAAAFSPDGRTVALPAADGTIKLWDAARLDPTASRQLGHLGPMVNALAFSPSMGDGEHWLASGDQTGIVKLWDLSNPQADVPRTMYPEQGRNPLSLPTPIAKDQSSIETALAPPEGGVLALAFSPDGRWLACSSTSELWFWDLKQSPPDQPTVLLPMEEHLVWTKALAFHPRESSLLAAGGSDGKVLIWNLSDLKAKDNPRHLSGHSASITRLLFTADGLRLISASEDGVALRWPFDRLNADEVHPIPLDRLNAGITCLAMSTKAKEPLLAIGGADGDVRLCRANAEEAEPTPVTRSWGSNSAIVDLAFSDDGHRLAIATDDRSVHVVYVDRAKNPESSVRLEDQDQITTSIVLTRDDRLAFAAGPQGTIRVWPLRWTPKLDKLAPLLAVRNLSAVELDESFPNQTFHKTFRNLPIHFSLIESARLLAKNGQMAQATQRLEELLANDPKLRLDPGTEVKLSYARALIENGRKRASRGEKPKAISQFREAQKLVPGSLDDPQEEADKNELMGMAAEVKQLVLGIRKQLDTTNNQMDQFDYAAESRAGGAIDLLGKARIKYEEAQTKYKQVKELNRSGELDLLSQITVIGKGLKAVELDREARQLASEGKMPKAETKFDEAQKMEPETNRNYPSWYLALRVGDARATSAQNEGDRLAKEGKIREAIKKFELVVRLKKEVELVMRQRLSFFICPFTPEEMVKQVVSPQADEADEQGRDLAAQGKTKEASEKFQKARDLTRNVSNVYAYDPVKEAKQAAADAKLAKADRLLIEVSRLVQERRSDQAQTKLEEAKSLDPSVTCAVKDFEDRNSARQLVEDGIKESREHNLQGAIAKFRKAKELNPDLELDPAQLAWRHEAKAYLDEARRLAPSDPNEAKTALEKGLGLTARLRLQEPGRSLVDDPEKLLRLYPVLSAAQINLDPSSNPTIRNLCSNGFIDETRSVYERACVFDPLLEVPARFWNNLSRHAAIRGEEEAKRFKFASDLALASDPANTNFRDTRGLVRAMLGDRVGAIKDFEAYLWDCQAPRDRRVRKTFIALLRSETPIAKIFTKEVRERIKGE